MIDDPRTVKALVKHVGCGDLDGMGRCDQCDAIRIRLRALGGRPMRTIGTMEGLIEWLAEEQRKPDRWQRGDGGVLRFSMTLVELRRILAALGDPPGPQKSDEKTQKVTRMDSQCDPTPSRTAPASVPTSHTPGPWEIDYVIDGAFQIVGTIVGDKCVLAQRTAFRDRHDEFVANARLIAAAPELLAVLKKLRHVVYEQLQLDPVDGNYWSICEQADIAIAKAEGR